MNDLRKIGDSGKPWSLVRRWFYGDLTLMIGFRVNCDLRVGFRANGGLKMGFRVNGDLNSGWF